MSRNSNQQQKVLSAKDLEELSKLENELNKLFDATKDIISKIAAKKQSINYDSFLIYLDDLKRNHKSPNREKLLSCLDEREYVFYNYDELSYKIAYQLIGRFHFPNNINCHKVPLTDVLDIKTFKFSRAMDIAILLNFQEALSAIGANEREMKSSGDHYIIYRLLSSFRLFIYNDMVYVTEGAKEFLFFCLLNSMLAFHGKLLKWSYIGICLIKLNKLKTIRTDSIIFQVVKELENLNLIIFVETKIPTLEVDKYLNLDFPLTIIGPQSDFIIALINGASLFNNDIDKLKEACINGFSIRLFSESKESEIKVHCSKL